LVTIVFKYNGVVDKYIGDALMAVFGSLEDDLDAEFRAVSAALEFKLAIQAMNEDRARFGKEPISIGVGLNTGTRCNIGEILVGFIGSSQRLEYTCIGDTVNTSSRVCSMAKQNQVLISEFTYKHVADRVQAVQVGARQFKGKQQEVMVYEVFSNHVNPNSPDTVIITPGANALSPSTDVPPDVEGGKMANRS
jgi:adenylate cyclase